MLAYGVDGSWPVPASGIDGFRPVPASGVDGFWPKSAVRVHSTIGDPSFVPDLPSGGGPLAKTTVGLPAGRPSPLSPGEEVHSEWHRVRGVDRLGLTFLGVRARLHSGVLIA